MGLRLVERTTRRLAPTEARNRKRLDERVQALSRKVGFRVGPGLRDRVIYRELFLNGLLPIGFFILGVNLMGEREEGVLRFPPPLTPAIGSSPAA